MSCSKTVNEAIASRSNKKPSQHVHRWRRGVQLFTIAVLLLIPISGLFRIDPVAGAFIVLDRQIWFSDFFLVVGLWMSVSGLLVITYSLIGTAFCGWSCPQNTLSEWANSLTRKWLGKRADVSIEGVPMQVSAGKDKWLNWVILSAMFVIASMLAALVPMFYFYHPDVVWSFVSFREDARLAPSLYWIYTIFVLIILLDIAFIRHFWCRFMCVYRVWQHSFKTRETLRIKHDKSHADECANCNFCETECFVEIDPRQTETFDSCINCGECISACNSIRESRNTGVSLLRFELGEQDAKNRIKVGSNVGSVLKRAPWALLFSSIGIALFIWGLMSYSPYSFTAYRAETLQGNMVVDYRINVANKLYQPALLNIEIEGLPEGSYQLSSSEARFDSAGRLDVDLHLSESLAKGLYPFIVRLSAADGWQNTFRVSHFAAGKSNE